MFLDPAPSPFELRFRIFTIPVRVHPLFWLFSAIFGWDFLKLGFGYLALWVGAMFVSILVHELGHALTSMFFGQHAQIVLYAFGGLAYGHYEYLRRWQRIVVYLAGPAAGFLLYGLIFFFERFMVHVDAQFRPFWLMMLLSMLAYMNLIWSIFNLVPVQPLDGGQIGREICVAFSPENGLRFSLGLSFVVAGLAAVYSLIHLWRPELELWYPPFDPMFSAILFGMLALQNYQMLMMLERERRNRHYDDDRPW